VKRLGNLGSACPKSVEILESFAENFGVRNAEFAEDAQVVVQPID
jgi:hypothetical protein